jgi:integrase
MLTQHWTVKSITDIPTLSPHKQQPASQTPHPDSSTSNATQTQLHTVTAETRHTFGTRLVREGYDLVLVAELMGHARLDQVRRYSLPTQADRQRAIDSLLTDG